MQHGGFIMPDNRIDEIKALFADRLGMSRVDETKGLRELGLDSLDVVELCMELEDRYGIQFETEEFAQYKTVADLFASIEKKLAALGQ